MGKEDCSSDDEEEDKVLPPLSKRALRKIKTDGPYAGKNIVHFDNEGKIIKKDPDSDYLAQLRKSAAGGEQQDTAAGRMKIERDGDIDNDLQHEHLQEKHVKAMRKRIDENLEADHQTAKQRIKEKR